MRVLAVAVLFLFCSQGRAEFTWAEIEVEGLTCSMCARSVELKVRELSFVEDVKMDLVATTMRIGFKKGSNVDVRSLAEAVDESGFSVGYVNAAFVFDGLEVSDGHCVLYQDTAYSFVRTGDRTLDGETLLKFIGEPFLPEEELAGWENDLVDGCEHSGKTLWFVTVL